jgi:hypothetical protein
MDKLELVTAIETARHEYETSDIDELISCLLRDWNEENE